MVSSEFNKPAARPELVSVQIACDGQQVRFYRFLADVVASHPGADERVSRQIARSHPVTGQEEREPQDVLVIAFVDQPEGIHRASVTIRATAREVTKPLVRP